MLSQEPIYKPSSIFCFKPILLSAHKLIMLIYGDNRSPQRARLSTNPFPLSINHKGGLSYLLAKSTKDGAIQTSRDVHTWEDAPRKTSNHLEASFKSNKRESMDGYASSALGMKMAALTSQSLSHTPQSSSQALAWNNSRISSWREWRRVLNAQEGVCLGLGQQH